MHKDSFPSSLLPQVDICFNDAKSRLFSFFIRVAGKRLVQYKNAEVSELL
jgi:hypothetical protein